MFLYYRGVNLNVAVIGNVKFVDISERHSKRVKGSNKRLDFIEEDWAKIWKEHMEKIMNEENEWDHMWKLM